MDAISLEKRFVLPAMAAFPSLYEYPLLTPLSNCLPFPPPLGCFSSLSLSDATCELCVFRMKGETKTHDNNPL